MVYADTAFLPPKDTFGWQSLNLGIHRFKYTLHDNVELGATTSVPAGFAGIFPELKVAGPVADNVHLGVLGRGGVLGFFFGELPVVYLFGGGAMASFGDPDLQLTVGTAAYGMGANDDGDDEIVQLIYPHIGGSVRVADIAKLNLELGPAFVGDDEEWWDPGAIWPIFYGIRLHGEHLYGDVGFVLPASEAWFESFAKYMPLGVPLLSFGYSG